MSNNPLRHSCGRISGLGYFVTLTRLKAMPAKRKPNPKTDAERAAAYRKRVIQGENAPCTRLQTIISKRAKARLESAAAKYGLSMRELLEKLASEAERVLCGEDEAEVKRQSYQHRAEPIPEPEPEVEEDEYEEGEEEQEQDDRIAQIDRELRRLYVRYEEIRKSERPSRLKPGDPWPDEFCGLRSTILSRNPQVIHRLKQKHPDLPIWLLNPLIQEEK